MYKELWAEEMSEKDKYKSQIKKIITFISKLHYIQNNYFFGL